jgi:hypothetical protein
MKTVYTPAFKAQVVLELLKEEKSLSQLANEYKIHPNVLREWRTAAVSNLASLFERGDAPGRCAQARAGPSGGRRYAHLSTYGGPRRAWIWLGAARLPTPASHRSRSFGFVKRFAIRKGGACTDNCPIRCLDKILLANSV